MGRRREGKGEWKRKQRNVCFKEDPKTQSFIYEHSQMHTCTHTDIHSQSKTIKSSVPMLGSLRQKDRMLKFKASLTI